MRFLDPVVGGVVTRFIDMPIVNVGTASNLFHAVEESLAKQDLDLRFCPSCRIQVML